MGARIPPIIPVILSGGSGTRLWPLSIPERPKQFLAFGDTKTLFQETLARVSGRPFRPPLVVGNHEHRFLIAEQLRRAKCRPRAVMLEPSARNTAPACAAAAAYVAARDPDALMLVLPSDHVIGNPKALRRAVASAAAAAAQGYLVTFGIAPKGPHTGYGYIAAGARLARGKGARAVARFVEKPGARKARGLIARKNVYWNAGIFLFDPRVFLAELERFAPKTAAAARDSVKKGKPDLDFFRLDPKSFARAPAGAIDTVVMERTRLAAVLPVDMDWSDAVMVAPRARAEDVKALATRVAGAFTVDRARASRVTVYRPWGSYRALQFGARFQVKQISVKPGAALSLQYHRHRAEHWVVVAGRARVTRGRETFVLNANQSTYIPKGVRHRLANAGRGPLHLIEVQSGGYLGEDDIVRLEDHYGRA